MNRRQFLTAGCVGTVLSVSGCVSPFSSTVQLGGLSVVNYDNEPKEVEVEISKDGSTIHSDTVALSATADPTVSTGEREPVECAWDDDDGEYRIEAAVNGEEPTAYDVAENVDSECAYVEIEIYWDESIHTRGNRLDWITHEGIPRLQSCGGGQNGKNCARDMSM